MIEKKFVDRKIKELMVNEYVTSKVKNAEHSSTKIQRTPLGEKIIVSAAKPGFVVGRKGENIKAMTKEIKNVFSFENPQIEIREIEKIWLDPKIVAQKISSTLERFGAGRFKGIGHKSMEEIMRAGAYGVEILISGKVPGSRAKRWRFYKGYLKKCGNVAAEGVKEAIVSAKLKTGIIGIQVKIMVPDAILPDNITIKTEEEIKDSKEKPQEPKVKKTKKKKTKKKASKK